MNIIRLLVRWAKLLPERRRGKRYAKNAARLMGTSRPPLRNHTDPTVTSTDALRPYRPTNPEQSFWGWNSGTCGRDEDR